MIQTVGGGFAEAVGGPAPLCALACFTQTVGGPAPPNALASFRRAFVACGSFVAPSSRLRRLLSQPACGGGPSPLSHRAQGFSGRSAAAGSQGGRRRRGPPASPCRGTGTGSG